ncbi:hypothetical protein ACWKSP_25400 [Micromonosporaceae bacterium Da 78-11]
MTQLGVERTPRTAYPLSSVSPAGVSTLMPPHIQGAERRMERRVRTTGSRWGLRALVIGGLAGAAWLLTGSAAHAADPDSEPSGLQSGFVAGGESILPVTGLLRTAAQPSEYGRPAHQHHVVADILDVPHRVVTRSPAMSGEVTHRTIRNVVDAVLNDVDQILRHVAGSRRLTDGPAYLLPNPADLHPKSSVEQSQVQAVTPVDAVDRPHAVMRGSVPAALLRLHLGEASGTPATGSGTPEGGSTAILPVVTADSAMACHLLPIATDVEAPTVSPD